MSPSQNQSHSHSVKKDINASGVATSGSTNSFDSTFTDVVRLIDTARQVSMGNLYYAPPPKDANNGAKDSKEDAANAKKKAQKLEELEEEAYRKPRPMKRTELIKKVKLLEERGLNDPEFEKEVVKRGKLAEEEVKRLHLEKVALFSEELQRKQSAQSARSMESSAQLSERRLSARKERDEKLLQHRITMNEVEKKQEAEHRQREQQRQRIMALLSAKYIPGVRAPTKSEIKFVASLEEEIRRYDDRCALQARPSAPNQDACDAPPSTEPTTAQRAPTTAEASVPEAESPQDPSAQEQIVEGQERPTPADRDSPNDTDAPEAASLPAKEPSGAADASQTSQQNSEQSFRVHDLALKRRLVAKFHSIVP
jgi:hypothetical protein